MTAPTNGKSGISHSHAMGTVCCTAAVNVSFMSYSLSVDVSLASMEWK